MSPPDAHPPLLRALRTLATDLPPERVDQLWLFPARQIGKQESSLAVLCLFQDDADRREVVTLMTTGIPGDERSPRETRLTDHGSVPADRVERLVSGIIHRLRDDREVPRIERIVGEAARWHEVVGAPAGPG